TKRRLATVAARPPPTRSATTGIWAGEPSSSGQPCHHEPVSRATVGATAAVARITAAYRGSDPDCTTLVTHAAARSTASTTCSYTCAPVIGGATRSWTAATGR